MKNFRLLVEADDNFIVAAMDGWRQVGDTDSGIFFAKDCGMRISLQLKRQKSLHPMMTQIQNRERRLLMKGEQYAAQRAAKLVRKLEKVLTNWQ